MNTLITPSKRISDTIGHIYGRGMTTTSGGNLSIKDEQGNIWITPAGVDKGCLTESDIVCFKASAEVVGKHRPSSELPIHRQIYERRSDIGAVIHAHPEALVAYVIAGRVPDLGAIPQARVTCGDVVFTPYELPGSEKLGEVIADSFAANSEVFSVIMGNHGVVVAGKGLADAWVRFETLELCARALLQSHEIGACHVLGNEQLEKYEQSRPAFIPVSDGWRSSENDQQLRDKICQCATRACRQNLMISSYGSVSLRSEGDDQFVMTPNGVSRRELQASDLVTVKDGEVVSGGRPSRGLALHRAIYQKYPQIRCIITTQAPSVTAHAVAHQVVDVSTNPESWVFARDISLIPFGIQFGEQPSVPESLTPEHPVVIVENDCVLAMGESLVQTFDRIEVAEFTARSNIMAARLGGAQPISQARIDELRKAFL